MKQWKIPELSARYSFCSLRAVMITKQMGEIVLSNGGEMELDVLETEAKSEIAQLAEMKNQQSKIAVDSGGSLAAAAVDSSSVVMWERFLPKLAVRVLLVEADDSNRQIISALLRKCSYKVAAVSDGLQAWEVLKSRSQNIDLILTEVELPSISGYALLTLIMEHDTCKNIPVIMMSSHDSVSTVYNSMLRGAADFLVKPIRRNELQNLWQHVWRKHASSTSQQKIEATAENNAASNHSSGYMACIQRNRKCIEKGSDAQSSCTKPDVETEGANVEHVHCLSQPKTTKFLSDDANLYEFHGESGKTGALNNGTARGQEKKARNDCEQVNVIFPHSENNHAPKNSSKEAIDLIGAFDNYRMGTFCSPISNASTNKSDSLPLLDLSLRRPHPSSSVNQVNDETPRLYPSDASALSRYKNKPFHLNNPTSPSTCNQQKDYETNSEKQQSNHTPDYNSDAHGSKISPQKYVPVATIQSGLPETTFTHPQLRVISQPVPVRALKFENIINGFGTIIPQLYCAQSVPSLLPSQSPSFTHLNPFYPLNHQPSSSQQFHNVLDHRLNTNTDPSDYKQGQTSENLKDRGHVSPANDQSGNSGFYSGHYQSIGSGGNGNMNSNLVANASSDTAAEEGNEGASHRYMQREAALTKFRMKRKDRCFEKKVRYESRKKLAQQRPRVKGQFVRHPQPGSSSAG